MSISVVMAGGGTAGHTSPLLATAEKLLEHDSELRLVCVGTSKGLENRVIPDAGLPLQLIPPVPLPRSLSPALFSVPPRLISAIRAAEHILKNACADVVVGFGGYVALPVYLAARKLRIPIVVHEQNAIPGLANKIAARFAQVVAVSFPDTPLPKSVFVGLPMREAIAALDRDGARVPARERLGVQGAGAVLLVSGGSQGAQSLNQAVAAARAELLESGISIIHVLGSANFADDVRIEHPNGAVYAPFAYLDQMEAAYAAADLMLGRSGAGTVMETAMVGLPTLFVPLPHGNGEQGQNASFLVNAGAGLVVADELLTADFLMQQVPALLADQARLAEMSRKARDLVPATAAEKLAALVVETAALSPNLQS
ncbi:MAG: undecaprenyldiphospho-muramoylpentapeptide beta-N-acetylglucosaminyltransferase [Propionibacteriaceae bacterium]|nr:undecaprenyldiphospho-muramoylpentapeptide beta-N-acetylglucosaminyltransferase [Propionibacteriaceae bacterium]